MILNNNAGPAPSVRAARTERRRGGAGTGKQRLRMAARAGGPADARSARDPRRGWHPHVVARSQDRARHRLGELPPGARRSGPAPVRPRRLRDRRLSRGPRGPGFRDQRRDPLDAVAGAGRAWPRPQRAGTARHRVLHRPAPPGRGAPAAAPGGSHPCRAALRHGRNGRGTRPRTQPAARGNQHLRGRLRQPPRRARAQPDRAGPRRAGRRDRAGAASGGDHPALTRLRDPRRDGAALRKRGGAHWRGLRSRPGRSPRAGCRDADRSRAARHPGFR